MESRTKLGPGGRVVIPAAYRKALGLKAGDAVLLRLGKGEVRISTLTGAVRRAQAAIGRYARGQGRLTARLIAARRAEAKRG
jgi:AbrB family looped-hinge helix DNA binding protein